MTEMRASGGHPSALRGPLIALAILVSCGILAPSAYSVLSLLDLVPMTAPIYAAWLGWLQLVHAVAAIAIWLRRRALSTQTKAIVLHWGGLAFWYGLPAPIYYLLAMSIDELPSPTRRAPVSRACGPGSRSRYGAPAGDGRPGRPVRARLILPRRRPAR